MDYKKIIVLNKFWGRVRIGGLWQTGVYTGLDFKSGFRYRLITIDMSFIYYDSAVNNIRLVDSNVTGWVDLSLYKDGQIIESNKLHTYKIPLVKGYRIVTEMTFEADEINRIDFADWDNNNSTFDVQVNSPLVANLMDSDMVYGIFTAVFEETLNTTPVETAVKTENPELRRMINRPIKIPKSNY